MSWVLNKMIFEGSSNPKRSMKENSHCLPVDYKLQYKCQCPANEKCVEEYHHTCPKPKSLSPAFKKGLLLKLSWLRGDITAVIVITQEDKDKHLQWIFCRGSNCMKHFCCCCC